MKLLSLKRLLRVVMITSIFSSLVLSNASSASENPLTLALAESFALSDEPGIKGLEAKSQSLITRSVADAQLKDPKIQLGIVNLAADSFDFNQEPMTQLKVSYIQQFPSGDTLDIKRQKTLKQSEQVQTRLANRKLEILKTVRLTYLEILYWEQARNTVEQNRAFFTQLVEIVQSLFSVGRNTQQDLLRVQLELSKLDDRLAKIDQKISAQRLKLAQWVGAENSQQPLQTELPQFPDISIPQQMPQMIDLMIDHPKVQEIDKNQQVIRQDIQLVEESSKSGWGLNVSYGYRDDAPNGQDRADFLSAMVTFDLPLFTENRQDKRRLSREHEYQSQKNQRIALLRKMGAELFQLKVNHQLLEKRQALYRDKLLPQAKQRSDAALQAYQSDNGQFSNVMQAYIDNLNTKLDETRVDIDLLQTQAGMLYLLPDPASI